MKRKYICYLIGEDNFTLACAKVLLEHNFTINSICSNNRHLIGWARQNKITIHTSYVSFEKDILSSSCDFLFSILNSKILPKTVLKKAKILAINFHNALLPKYAGSHATSWAILNDESWHGVTWHKMSAEVDLGDIIKQGQISIDKRSETALSLNMKCTEVGLKLFEEMIIELEQSNYQLKRQNTTLRTYFPKHSKPRGNSLICWQDTAENISRLFRACDFAHSINEFSLPKIVLNDQGNHFLAKQIKITQIKSTFTPGTIVEISDKKITIATQSYNVSIREIYDCYGKKWPIRDFIKANDITNNIILPSYSAEMLEEFSALSEAFSSQERKWVEKFSRVKLPLIPEIIEAKCIKKSKGSKVFNFDINCDVTQRIKKMLSVSESFITLSFVLTYLWRINNYENFDIGILRDNFFRNKQIEKFFFNFFWFRCDFDPEIYFNELVARLSLELSKAEYNTNCLKDVLARYPGVQNNYVLPDIIISLDNEITETVNTPIVIRINGYSASIIMNVSNEGMAQDQQYLIESMGLKIRAMLEGLAMNLEIPLYKLPLLNNSGLSLYVDTWSGRREKTPSYSDNIMSIFEEQVTKYPSKTAIVEKNLSITYEDLNLQANNLAAFLLKSKVKPGEYVGVISISGIETIIALVAILKVGAVYVPIDPDYPDFYVSNILNDVKPRLILSKAFSSAKFEAFLQNEYPSVMFHLIQHPIQTRSYEDVQVLHRKTLAYVMYTSGSTGRPKGVKITQQAIIRLVIDNNFLKIKPDYNIAQASNLSFDASTLEIWGALLNGATLVCVSKEDTLNSVKFKNILEEANIDILWVTASLFDRHIQNCPKIFNSIKYLLAGGDVVNPNSVRKVFNKDSKVETFINGYGPTENTTFTTTFSIKPNDSIIQSIPIGRPIANTSVYVVDQYLQPVPVGIPGELLIAGIGLADGYIASEDNARFFETSKITGKIQRYYRTGDYVKWLNDGNLAYLGRKDSQIKLRGFRIEINAIKDLLLAHEKISQCHIQICENSQLHLYIIPEHDSDLRRENVFEYLKSNLPYYMLPSEIMFLDQFPVNANGKIDVAALKNFSLKEEKRLLRMPESEVEKSLLAIWQSILNNNEISTDDNFFEIGGNSLLVASLIYKIYQEFNVHIAISDFLTNPTVLFLANLVFGNVIKSKSDIILNDVNIDLRNYLPRSFGKIDEKNRIYRNVFVTGATGFLGAFILQELSKDKTKKIYCLVRANTFRAAYAKLENSLKQWNISPEILKNIFVFYGDLSQDLLGLSKKKYEVLLSEIDEIYHVATHVNHIYSYAQLRSDNVLATLNLLKMLSQKHVKFNYISTISAGYEHTDKEDRILESFISEDPLPEKITDGYSLTKWVSEKILYKIHELGFNINIFRPAWISGSSVDGSMPTVNNHLHLLVQACIQLKSAPAWDVRINMTPVDEVAKAVILGGQLNSRNMNVFNIVNNQTISWKDYIKVIKDFGYNIKLIEPTDWYNLLLTIDKDNALFRLVSLYTNEKSRDWILKQDSISNAHNENYLLLRSKLKNKVEMDVMLLARYVKYAFGVPVKDKKVKELSKSPN